MCEQLREAATTHHNVQVASDDVIDGGYPSHPSPATSTLPEPQSVHSPWQASPMSQNMVAASPAPSDSTLTSYPYSPTPSCQHQEVPYSTQAQDDGDEVYNPLDGCHAKLKLWQNLLKGNQKKLDAASWKLYMGLLLIATFCIR